MELSRPIVALILDCCRRIRKISLCRPRNKLSFRPSVVRRTSDSRRPWTVRRLVWTLTQYLATELLQIVIGRGDFSYKFGCITFNSTQFIYSFDKIRIMKTTHSFNFTLTSSNLFLQFFLESRHVTQHIYTEKIG